MSPKISGELARIYVQAGGEPRVVTCRFGSDWEADVIRAWSRQTKNRDADARDALEFAKHTTKRWAFYVSSKRAVSSLAVARSRVKRAPRTELAFFVVLTADLAPHRALGFTLFRRSWCNHLVVDFIAAHPGNRENKASEVRGVLRAIFCAITDVATALGSARIWGEATDSSADKYRHIFDLAEVDDLFILESKVWRTFRRKSRSARA